MAYRARLKSRGDYAVASRGGLGNNQFRAQPETDYFFAASTITVWKATLPPRTTKTS